MPDDFVDDLGALLASSKKTAAPKRELAKPGNLPLGEPLPPVEIAPGQYTDIPMDRYLRVPALSASVLCELDQRCPFAAWYTSWLNPVRVPDYNDETDCGEIAHALLLEGSVERIAVIDPADYPAKSSGNIPNGWTNVAIRAARDDARNAGKIPMLPCDVAVVNAMVDSAHRYIESLKKTEPAIWRAFQPDGGDSELSCFWDDDGILCRLRTDRISKDRSLIVDVKTTKRSAEPDGWARAMFSSMGLRLRGAWYGIRGAEQVFRQRASYVMLVMEQRAPYLCSLVGLDPTNLEIGERKMKDALSIWRQCMADDYWPAYPSRVAYPEARPWEIAEAESLGGSLPEDYDFKQGVSAMTVNFRKAITSEAKPLVGLYSESGCGKTYSALLLAKGFVGDMSRVAMIETEAGRGEAYADDPVVGGYNVFPIRGDFSPKVYGQAIGAAEKEGFQAIITDSASHEWEGIGGVLAMAADNQAAGKKGVLVWQQPKILHAREFMLRLQQTPIPLVIVCMRAKYPMYEVTAKHVEEWEQAGRPGGKPPKVGDWARSWKLDPKQSDDILFEMFVHGWIDQEHKFHGTKYTRAVMQQIFLDNQPITVDTGKRLAQWAGGRGPAAVDPTADLRKRLETAAANGTEALQAAWKLLTKAERTEIGGAGLDALKRAAAAADASGEDLDFGAPTAGNGVSEGDMPKITPAYITDMLTKARDTDTIDIAEDFIRSVGEEFHAELHELAKNRRQELRL